MKREKKNRQIEEREKSRAFRKQMFTDFFKYQVLIRRKGASRKNKMKINEGGVVILRSKTIN